MELLVALICVFIGMAISCALREIKDRMPEFRIEDAEVIPPAPVNPEKKPVSKKALAIAEDDITPKDVVTPVKKPRKKKPNLTVSDKNTK